MTGLAFLPGGDLWGTTDGTTGDIIRIDPTTAVVTTIGTSNTDGELAAQTFCGRDPTIDATAGCNASAVTSTVDVRRSCRWRRRPA